MSKNIIKKYVTQEYLNNSNFRNLCNDCFEEHHDKLYMQTPSFGFDVFKAEEATIIKIDENRYMITQPYYVCDNYCAAAIIFIEKTGNSYKMTDSRVSNSKY